MNNKGDLLKTIIFEGYGGGTLAADCELCGRVHFSTGYPNSYEEGELEELEKKSAENPDKYISHDTDSITIGAFAGKQIVGECTCDGLDRYAEALWLQKEIIAPYLRRRAQAEVNEAAKSVEVLEGLAT